MKLTEIVWLAVSVLIVVRMGVELWLEWLNQRHTLAHGGNVPEPFRGMITSENYARSIDYTMAKSRLSQVESIYDALVLAFVLFSGILPALHGWFIAAAGQSAWSMAAFLMSTGFVVGLFGLPLAWYEQFHLEERFGFNTTTAKLWWLDRFKAWLLAIVIGWPLLALILKIVDWMGDSWWLWAWATVLVFQLAMVVIAPIFILPLFNKFTPLGEGTLRDRLFALAERTGFPIRNIQVMDSSKRSRHSNAFFTGFGRFRRVVLFDTLVQQLSESELEAVLAHEIGHYKKRHIPKLMLWSAAMLFAGFYVIAVLAKQEWLYGAFGFSFGSIAPALLLFGLLSGTITFWIAPLANFWSRRYEYEADAFAAEAVRQIESMIGALRKLNEKNLSNLTPHPLYSRFYYSHPTLFERERALRDFD